MLSSASFPDFTYSGNRQEGNVLSQARDLSGHMTEIKLLMANKETICNLPLEHTSPSVSVSLQEFVRKYSYWVTCHVIKCAVSYLPEWCDSSLASGPHSAAGPRQHPAGSPLRRVPVGSILALSRG